MNRSHVPESSSVERAARSAPALSLRHISKSFGGTPALDDATLELHAGEVHALLGENGAGKTTLMRIAYGLEQPDAGQIVVASDRRPATGDRLRSPREARALGIGMVHQHFTSIPALTVAENIALAAGWREAGNRLQRRAAAVIADLGLPLDPAARAATLSVQLRQRLEIVQALASQARVLLLDEPTAVLAPREVAELMNLVRRLADSGSAVVLISHKLREIREVADRVTVLRNGRVTLRGLPADHDDAALSRAMIGASPALGPEPERRGALGSSRLIDAGEKGPARITIEQGSDAPITWHAGEVVGIAAVEGNGQRALLRALAGLEPPPPGLTIRTDGEVGFIPEDRTTEGLIGAFSLTENYALGLLDRLPRWLDWNRLRDATRAVIAGFDVRAESPERRADELSGGNQQKFVLGRTFERHPEIVIAEDATRGLDLRATATIHERLRRAAREGAVVVFHASDLDEVIALTDRLMVMHDGRLTEWPRDTARALIGDAMLGLDPAPTLAPR